MQHRNFMPSRVNGRRWRCLVVAFVAALIAGGPAFLSDVRGQSTATLAEGTPVQVRLTQAMGTELNDAGDRFETILDQDLRSGNTQIARAGSILMGEVLEAEESGRVKGRARMALTLRELRVDGVDYPIKTNTIVIEAEGTRGEDAKVIGGSAGVGALLGAIIGGKRGAVIGATVGAGAGTTAVLVTDGKEVKFDPEQRFRFHLTEPFRADSTVARAASGIDRSREVPGRGRNQVELRNSIKDLSSRASALRNIVETNFVEASHNSADFRLYLLMSDLFSAADLIYQRSIQNPDEGPLASDIAAHLTDQREKINQELGQRQIDGTLRSRWNEFEEALNELLRISSSIRSGTADSANQSGTLSWRGYVDEEDYVILQDDAVQVQNSKGRPAWNISYQLSTRLPRGPVQMTLNQTDGRGRVEVLERPSRWNDYRAVIRISDPDSGSDYYMFTLDWESENIQ